MQLIEVIGGITLFASPLEAKPLYVALDRVDVLLVLLGRVGVIETQVALTTELLRQAKVQANRLGVPDVQITVGLRGETGDDLGMLAGVQVSLDDRTEKVASGGSLGLAHGVLNDQRVCGLERFTK